MNTTNYTVSGMTCSHCVESVIEEVGAVPGVTDLEVDLATGALRVTTNADSVDDAAISAAVSEAGYQLVS